MGEKRAVAFHESGIRSVFDLLRFAPRRYEDRRNTLPLSSLRGDETLQGVFRGRLEQVKIAYPRRNLSIVWALFRDQSGEARARWFNQPYLARSLKQGQEYFLFGKGAPHPQNKTIAFLENPEWEDATEPPVAPWSDCLTPVYRSGKTLTDARITHRWLRKLIAGLLAHLNWETSFPSDPGSTLFPRLRQAICDLHWPFDLQKGNRGREAMAFFDMVLFQMGVLKRREQLGGLIQTETERRAPVEPGYPLPYPLTADQKQSLADVLGDLQPTDHRTDDAESRMDEDESGEMRASITGGSTMESGRPMNRLLQGEVGSGKTVVAFLAMRHLAELLEPGCQAAMMAPTEILARQHYASFLRLFPELAEHTAFLAGSMSGGEKAETHRRLREGPPNLRSPDVRQIRVESPLNGNLSAGSPSFAETGAARARFVFGTHALFQEGCRIPGLRLAIVDEQQRFGVEHRRALLRRTGKSEADAPPPHLLMISATPIPRTLALTAFGDLDVSVISMLPPGRLPVTTHLHQHWEETLPVIEQHVRERCQTYYICPRIEMTEKTDWGAVKDAEVRLRQRLPNLRIASLTGKDAPEVREETLKRFGAGQIDVLVATTIVEVGMDFPNATLLIVENAERFGLSQLHQLRGRIGRGTQGGTCLIVSEAAEENERLQIFCGSHDGFAIAAADLRFRGPGDLVGTRQSGLNHPALAHLDNPERILQARERARQILSEEPAAVRTWFEERMQASFGDAWQKFMEGG